MGAELLQADPVPTLLSRAQAELAADFDFGKPIRVSRAPGRLDVMGGVADYTGSLVCEYPLDRAAAVIMQPRSDRVISIFSFNLFDDHVPFTFRMPIERLASCTAGQLHKEFSEPGRKFAGYIAGCLYLLHEQRLINLAEEKQGKGMNLAIYSTVPLGAGVSSSAAIEVATMVNLVEHFGLMDRMEPLKLAEICQSVENRIVGAPCGIMDQVTTCFGEAGAFQRILCQPHQLLPHLFLPKGFRTVGINSRVRHSVGGGQYGKTRCAAFMAHAIILAKMREIGHCAGKELVQDPMNGYLANLNQDDYKSMFRPYLPELLRGSEFLAKYSGTIDKATAVRPDWDYHVQRAADHHVLEARRVRQFCEFVEQAAMLDVRDNARHQLMDKAGHLMYASHLSYMNDALLGADECDLIVQMVKKSEKEGLYGARITGGGCGGTVAVLCDSSERADAAIRQIMVDYEKQTGKKPEAFTGTSRGAWHHKSTMTFTTLSS